ncbi:MAG: tyrosine-protein phosphatase [Deltaproteobacteria bacterium]|nr:tyrosine-protein phosphatase [Deltaproteobacteria bacterium]
MRRATYILLSVLVLVIGFELMQIAGEDTTFTSALSNIAFRNNFHTVVEGRFFRSAEMPPDELERVYREHGVRTVLDLRLGAENAEALTIAERLRVEQLGGDYVHFPLRGSRVPTHEQMRELISILDNAKTPVLVHCTSGSHRSGLVAAVWLMTQEGQSVDVAKGQLAPVFGFFRFERALKSYIQGHPTLDNLLWIFESKSRETGISFREWVGWESEKSQAQSREAPDDRAS